MQRLGWMMIWLGLSACSADAGAPRAGDGVDVPVARLASADARVRGREVFSRHCALCHGAGADGRGVRRSALTGKPADFRSAAWRETATPERLFGVLRDGVPGSSMPSWVSLSVDDRWDVIAYVLSVARQGA